MSVRNIVKIDEEKCNGCGDCVIACAEGAIEIIDGKAKLVSEIYCDGLGACLGTCPMDAITIEQREVDEFDEKATEEHLANQKPQKPDGFVCPGSMVRQMNKPKTGSSDGVAIPSQLAQWPVLMGLVSPQAPYFKNADLLLVADCVPFAMGDFHNKILKGRAIAVGCPKFDDSGAYIDKLAAIIQQNDLNSLSVIHMEVPCCFGLTHIAKEAIAKSGSDLSFDDVTIGLDGEIQKTEKI
ncbi:MAG: 4Fe-4S binding protein [Planctomycetes bacterium]|nr:4Fe-4S binding protein [Planctomycetota bacterium]